MKTSRKRIRYAIIGMGHITQAAILPTTISTSLLAPSSPSHRAPMSLKSTLKEAFTIFNAVQPSSTRWTKLALHSSMLGDGFLRCCSSALRMGCRVPWISLRCGGLFGLRVER